MNYQPMSTGKIAAITVAGTIGALAVFGLAAGCSPQAQQPNPTVTVTEPAPAVTVTRTPLPDVQSTETPKATATQSEAPSPKITETPAETRSAGVAVTVTSVVDGDTINTTAGKVRLIGIDTPEQGQCNYALATAQLSQLISEQANQVVLVPGAQDDKDKYDRLLRYVESPSGTDLNLQMIQSGLAIARYDSRDGYGTHAREGEYVIADAANDAPGCATSSTPTQAPPAPETIPAPAPEQEASGGGLDPQFPTCKAALANGYGNYVKGVNPEYGWYKDADGDGVVCEG